MTPQGIAGGIERFAARYKRVWHVMEAEGAGCETLYPAATLHCLAGLPADNANRDDFQRVSLPEGRAAILRMQLMPDARLSPTLAGVFTGRPDLWREHINRHVFFWLCQARRDRFISACARLRARGGMGPGPIPEVPMPDVPAPVVPAPVVIELDTALLLAAHETTAFFSRINTGSTIRGGAWTRRDETTLRPVHSWAGERAAELAIRAPVPLAFGLSRLGPCGRTASSGAVPRRKELER